MCRASQLEERESNSVVKFNEGKCSANMFDARFVISKLSGLNWQTWKIRLEMLLCRENLWSVVAETK